MEHSHHGKLELGRIVLIFFSPDSSGATRVFLFGVDQGERILFKICCSFAKLNQEGSNLSWGICLIVNKGVSTRRIEQTIIIGGFTSREAMWTNMNMEEKDAEFVCVYQPGNPANASLARSALEENDIPCYVENESFSSALFGEIGIGAGRMRVMVPRNRAEEAAAILADLPIS